MPFQSTLGSNTVKGYRYNEQVGGDLHWDDVILLLQPQSADTAPVDYSPTNKTLSSTRGTTPIMTSGAFTDPYGGSSVTINFQPTNTHVLTVDQIADEVAASSDPDTWTAEGWFNVDTGSLASNNTQMTLFGFHGNTFSPDNNPHVDNFAVFWVGRNSYTSQSQAFYKINQNGSNLSEDPQSLGVALVFDQWYHVALVNNGGTLSYYINGTRVRHETGYTLPTVRNDDSFQIGADQDATATNDYLNGQCSEFRFTKNIARYTGTVFTPPTKKFPGFGLASLPGSFAGIPATTETEARTYLNTVNGANSAQLMWFQHPQVNGGSAYRCPAMIDDTSNALGGYVFALCGKLGAANQNSQISTATGKPVWMWHNNPGGTVVNDWGTDTHTHRPTSEINTGTFNTSMRTRNWPELAGRYKRLYFHSVDTVGTGDILYLGTRGTTLHGPAISWGELMEQVPTYALNNADGGDSHKFPNEVGVAVAALSRINNASSSVSSTVFDHLYLGGNDNENVPVSTNDGAMIIGRSSLVQQTTPFFANPTSPTIFALGAKRSSFNTTTGWAETTDSPPVLPDDQAVLDTVGNNTHGGVSQEVCNGRVAYDRSCSVLFYTRFQGGDGSTSQQAFDGSPGDLDKIWYGGSIPDGLYYFRSTNTNLGIIRLYIENGYAKIPTGTSSIAGSSITSATLTNSNYHTKYVNNATISSQTGDASTSDMEFDASNRFGNLSPNNTSTLVNRSVGYIIFDIGITFRRIFVNLTVQSPTSTGTGATNSDWQNTPDISAWSAGTLNYVNGYKDFPFAVVPYNDTNLLKTLNGNTVNNASSIASGGWGTGEQGDITRQWTSVVTDCGQAAQRTEFGFGFAGFGDEEYRFNEGFWYLR